MVIGHQWGVWKISNSERAQRIRDLILNESWWARVTYVLDFTEPIMTMLCFADTDTPCLGDVYDGMDTMVEKVKHSIQAHESDPTQCEALCKQVQAIINHRWNKMTTPLHLLAYALSPRYYSEEIVGMPGRVAPFADEEVAEGCHKALSRLFPLEEIHEKVREEFGLFASGLKHSPFALKDQNRLGAITWWYMYGQPFKHLQPLAIKVLSQAVPTKSMGKKGVKRGRQTAAKKEPSPSLKNYENLRIDTHNKDLDHKQLAELNHCEAERRITAIQAICDAQIEHVLTQLRVARSMFSNEQLSMPLPQFLKEYCPNTVAIKNPEGVIELERKTQNYDADESHVGEGEWRKSLGCQGSFEQQSVSVDDQITVMPTPVGFHFTSSAVKEKFLRSIGIHVSNLAFEENSEIKIIDGESSFQTPNADGKTSSSIGITPKSRRLPKQGEMLLSVHGSPLGVYREDRMDTISEADKEL